MKRKWVELTGGLIALSLATLAAGQAPAAPNIIFMMADDLGYNDLACYGQALFPTPNTDRLAEQGIRLTDAYSPSAVCSPTRYAVLTGTDPFRRYHTSHVLFNGEPLVIEPGQETVASLLKKSGYATGVIGKWHLGLGDSMPRDLNHPGRGPNDIGFDYSFLVPDGHNMYPRYYIENGEVVGGTQPPFASRLQLLNRLDYRLLQNLPVGEWENRRPEERIGATLADKVDAFLEQSRTRPFFLYYPTCSIHHPQKPDVRFQGKSGIGPHGDFVMEFDWAVGRVMDKLEQLGLAENTLLIVTSDNGGLAEVADGRHRPSDPWRGHKASEYEGGHRVPFLARWPGRIELGTLSHAPVSLVDLAATAAALTGAELPADAALDSFDILPALTNGAEQVRPYVVTGRRGMTRMAIRRGDWKLIVTPQNGSGKELYNLQDDLGEKTNLAQSHPEKTEALWQRLNSYAEQGSSRPGATGEPAGFEKLFAEREAHIREVGKLAEPAVPDAPVEPFSDARPAVLEASTGHPTVFKPGVRLFTNRSYSPVAIPAQLAGDSFLCAKLGERIGFHCLEEGMVWVATPSAGVNPDSLEGELLKAGFRKTGVPPFHLFKKVDGNRCVVFQKKMEKGERATVGKWGLLFAEFKLVGGK